MNAIRWLVLKHCPVWWTERQVMRLFFLRMWRNSHNWTQAERLTIYVEALAQHHRNRAADGRLKL